MRFASDRSRAPVPRQAPAACGPARGPPAGPRRDSSTDSSQPASAAVAAGCGTGRRPVAPAGSTACGGAASAGRQRDRCRLAAVRRSATSTPVLACRLPARPAISPAGSPHYYAPPRSNAAPRDLEGPITTISSPTIPATVPAARA